MIEINTWDAEHCFAQPLALGYINDYVMVINNIWKFMKENFNIAYLLYDSGL